MRELPHVEQCARQAHPCGPVPLSAAHRVEETQHESGFRRGRPRWSDQLNAATIRSRSGPCPSGPYSRSSRPTSSRASSITCGSFHQGERLKWRARRRPSNAARIPGRRIERSEERKGRRAPDPGVDGSTVTTFPGRALPALLRLREREDPGGLRGSTGGPKGARRVDRWPPTWRRESPRRSGGEDLGDPGARSPDPSPGEQAPRTCSDDRCVTAPSAGGRVDANPRWPASPLRATREAPDVRDGSPGLRSHRPSRRVRDRTM